MCVAALPGVSLFFAESSHLHSRNLHGICLLTSVKEREQKDLSPLSPFSPVSPLSPLFVSLMGRRNLGKVLSAAKDIGGFSKGCPCPWDSLGLLISAPYFGHCTGWQSPKGDVQELAEDTAKEVQRSSGLTSGTIRKLFLGHSDREQYHFQALLAPRG